MIYHAPADVDLVVGSGHIYEDAIRAFQGVSARPHSISAQSVELSLGLSGGIGRHPFW